MGNQSVESVIERAFAAVDTDKSGELSRIELKALLMHMQEPHSDDVLDELMAHFDPDQSGTISLEEFKAGWEEFNALAVKNAGLQDEFSVESAFVSGSRRAITEQLQDDT